MKIGLLPIGSTSTGVILRLQEDIVDVFHNSVCIFLEEGLPLPPQSLNPARLQYRSERILGEVQRYAAVQKDLDRVLGVVEVDIYVEGLNFVFGQASCPGKAGLISLWRLRPEFYGAAARGDLLVDRSLKEAVHELAHTLGLGHCRRPSCVMFFSNSIADTDRKNKAFCNSCNMQLGLITDNFSKA